MSSKHRNPPLADGYIDNCILFKGALEGLLLSRHFDQDILNRLFNNGVQYYIHKPAEFPQLKKVIQYTLTLIAQDNISQPTS